MLFLIKFNKMNPAFKLISFVFSIVDVVTQEVLINETKITGQF